MNLRYHKSSQGDIVFFSLFGMFELFLKQRLPISHTLWVIQFCFSNKLHILKQGTIFLCTFRPLAFVTMVDIRLARTVEWSAFGIFAIAFT